ncbi:hypothetical protein [Desulfosporosinus meridiei]|nr:hypothetical protein [Desulfosporosinus meridiei]
MTVSKPDDGGIGTHQYSVETEGASAIVCAEEDDEGLSMNGARS